MTANEWEKIWGAYITALVKRDELRAARESMPFGQRPTRRRIHMADLHVAKAIRAIERVDKPFADKICGAYWE